MALASFSHSLAREGAKYNIHCNTIAPMAASRMYVYYYLGVNEGKKELKYCYIYVVRMHDF